MNIIEDFYLNILGESAVAILVLGFIIHRYRKPILKNNVMKFLAIFVCGLVGAWVPWTIFGIMLGFVPLLLATMVIYFWHDKVGSQSRVRTFLTITGAATIASFFVGGTPCGAGLKVLEYAWQSILIASTLATFLLAKRKWLD